MKIIHVSDVHFDIPFKRLSDRENLGKERRLEQREAFRSLIDFSKEDNVDVILIAGDLFEQEYIRESTEDPNLETKILDIGDGLAVTKRRD